MPRSKDESHKRVLEAAREEFILKGYKGASMRSIGEKALMTQAGLYRHFKNKEEMFDAVVKPALDDINELVKEHMNDSFNLLVDKDMSRLFNSNNVSIVKEVIKRHYEEFRLILVGSNGTKYENFVQELVNYETKEMVKAISYLKEQGYVLKELDEDELHSLISAYDTAILEGIVRGLDIAKINKILDQVEEFFIPAWASLMGLAKLK